MTTITTTTTAMPPKSPQISAGEMPRLAGGGGALPALGGLPPWRPLPLPC